jgi:hypothetical protein
LVKTLFGLLQIIVAIFDLVKGWRMRVEAREAVAVETANEEAKVAKEAEKVLTDSRSVDAVADRLRDGSF